MVGLLLAYLAFRQEIRAPGLLNATGEAGPGLAGPVAAPSLPEVVPALGATDPARAAPGWAEEQVADLLGDAIAACPVGAGPPLRVRARVDLGPGGGAAVLEATDPASVTWARCLAERLHGAEWPTVEDPAVVRRELRRGR